MKQTTTMLVAAVALVAAGAGFAVYKQGWVSSSGRMAGSAMADNSVVAISTAMPMGVTLEPIGSAQGYRAQRLALPIDNDLAFANEKGMTLYAYDKDEAGKSNCTGDCTKTWMPFTPLAGAKPVQGWMIVSREDGSKQWAHNGHPLYFNVKDKEPGEVLGLGAPPGGETTSLDGGIKLNLTAVNGVPQGNKGLAHTALFPEGWHTEYFQRDHLPATGVTTPPLGFAIKEVVDANGVILTEARGLTVYTFAGDVNNDKVTCGKPGCADHFSPVAAPMLARPAGDWNFVLRDDGIKQWTYKGKALYTFDGDKVQGDVNGIGVDAKWRVSTLIPYYKPSNIVFRDDIGKGRILATADGRTLYRRDVGTYNPATTQLAHDRPYRFRIGRITRDTACRIECQKSWHPYLAPADAEPTGYWNVIKLADGTKQWTYKDFALFTYDGDKKAGDMTGDSIYDTFVSDDPNHDNDKDVGFPSLYQASLYWTFATL